MIMGRRFAQKKHLTPSSPDWLPGDKRIAFIGEDLKRGFGIYTIGLNGRGFRTVRVFPEISRQIRPIHGFRVSPDGRRFAFIRNDPDLDGIPRADIVVMNSDGSGLKTLASNECDVNSLDWSPDGRRLLATWQEDDPAHYCGYHETASGIYLLSAAGGAPHRIYAQTAVLTGHGNWAYENIPDATFSPDGTRIAFTVDASSVDNGGLDDVLKVMRPDGSGVHQILKTGPTHGYIGCDPCLGFDDLDWQP
jgi:Tol biopolymer transport system component